LTVEIDKAVYGQLLVKFQPKVIETKEEYNQARTVVLQLIMRPARSPEETALLMLIATLVKEFERKQEKPEEAPPREILKHLMEENNMKQIDLVGKLGSRGVVSEIVNGKRSISKSQAKVLSEIFHVSPAVFI
jgi:HTH-type transcriptional regulator / antitoxin HigA